jgi:hypothetical protein
LRALRRKIPVHSQQQEREKKSLGVVIRGDLIRVVGSHASEGVPGIGVAKAVDVSVKKNLVSIHAVALKDGDESVVVLVEAKVTSVGVDRSSSCRKGATRAACVAG